MWRNYLTVGYRALTRNRTYAAINIVGLAVGLAACLMLLLYVRYETSYDEWLPEADRAYQVQSFGQDPETGERIEQQGATQPVAEALAKDFPQIEAISRFDSVDDVIVQNGVTTAAEMMRAADPGFFRIIQIPFLRGNRARALEGMDGLVLSRSEAIRRFGTLDVLGRTVSTILAGEPRDLRVTGVFEDLPKNSHMAFGMVRRLTAKEIAECPWGCVTGMIYLKLRPGVSAGAIHAQMPAWEKRNVPPRDVAGGDIGRIYDWRLVSLPDIHLGPGQDGDRPGNDIATLATFGIVALLILGMACVNFINLATARASRRAREVAVRKVLGARRSQLVIQFLGESLLVVAVAMLLALTLLELALPAFSALLDVDMDLRYFGAGGLAPPVLGLILLVGLAGGLYPAFYLSRYQPGAVLKANHSLAETPGTGRLRNLLVIVQFAISIGLIVCTAVVHQQTLFARSTDPGFEREGLLQIYGLHKPEVGGAVEALTREIERIDGVSSAAGTMIVPGSGRTLYTTVAVPGRDAPVQLGWYSVEPDFFATMKTPIVAGRALSPSHSADKATVDADDGPAADAEIARIAARGFNIVVNQAAVARLGFGSAAAAVGKQIGVPLFGQEVGPVAATIVGVAQDSRYRSLRQPVEPILYYDRGVYIWLAVRYDGADPQELLREAEGVWRRLLPQVPFEADFAEEKLAGLYGADEARGRTFGGFAVLAIAIACLGLFGLAAFTAERRTKEIGIRKVFGARIRDIVQLLAWQFSKPVIVANLVAWPVAWWLMRDWLNGFDARIALGPGPFLLAGFLALAIALGTIAGHAVKVARLTPIHALRYE
jgi:putative ABC transport system permease protein